MQKLRHGAVKQLENNQNEVAAKFTKQVRIALGAMMCHQWIGFQPLSIGSSGPIRTVGSCPKTKYVTPISLPYDYHGEMPGITVASVIDDFVIEQIGKLAPVVGVISGSDDGRVVLDAIDAAVHEVSKLCKRGPATWVVLPSVMSAYVQHSGLNVESFVCSSAEHIIVGRGYGSTVRFHPNAALCPVTLFEPDGNTMTACIAFEMIDSAHFASVVVKQ